MRHHNDGARYLSQIMALNWLLKQYFYQDRDKITFFRFLFCIVLHEFDIWISVIFCHFIYEQDEDCYRTDKKKIDTLLINCESLSEYEDGK